MYLDGQWERDRIERQLEIETPSYTARVQNVQCVLAPNYPVYV